MRSGRQAQSLRRMLSDRFDGACNQGRHVEDRCDLAAAKDCGTGDTLKEGEYPKGLDDGLEFAHQFIHHPARLPA